LRGGIREKKGRKCPTEVTGKAKRTTQKESKLQGKHREKGV